LSSKGTRTPYRTCRLGDYQDEVGIIDRRYASHRDESPDGAIIYWHADDLAAAVKDLLAGAPRSTSRSSSAAMVSSPLGGRPVRNILGIMYNPHYVEILAAH